MLVRSLLDKEYATLQGTVCAHEAGRALCRSSPLTSVRGSVSLRAAANFVRSSVSLRAAAYFVRDSLACADLQSRTRLMSGTSRRGFLQSASFLATAACAPSLFAQSPRPSRTLSSMLGKKPGFEPAALFLT